mgnify:CR=1 FL=1
MAGLLSAFLIFMRLFGMKLARLLPKPLFAIYGMFHKGTLDSLDIKQMPILILLSTLGWLLEAGRLFFIIKEIAAPTSARLWVGIFVAIPTAMPEVPLTKRFGKRAENPVVRWNNPAGK